jgi:hypothetical protein
VKNPSEVLLTQAKESGINISDDTQMKNFIELYKKHQTGELYLSNELNHLSGSTEKEPSRNSKYWGASTQGS